MLRAIPELAGNSILLPHQNSLNDLMISAIFHFYLFIYYYETQVSTSKANFIITLLNTSEAKAVLSGYVHAET